MTEEEPIEEEPTEEEPTEEEPTEEEPTEEKLAVQKLKKLLFSIRKESDARREGREEPQ